MIDEGVRYQELQCRLDDLARRTWVFFSTTTLEYLRKGGRISEPVYRLGSMLDIKPVITCNQTGHYVVARKARGWERSLKAEIALVREKASGFKAVRLAICCSDSCADLFDGMEERLRAEMDALGVEIESLVRSDVSADLLVHTGPDLVGVGVEGIR
jgi:DegV family protein with EDD domain